MDRLGCVGSEGLTGDGDQSGVELGEVVGRAATPLQQEQVESSLVTSPSHRLLNGSALMRDLIEELDQAGPAREPPRGALPVPPGRDGRWRRRG